MAETDPKGARPDEEAVVMEKKACSSKARKSARRVLGNRKRPESKFNALAPKDPQSTLEEGVVMDDKEKILLAMEYGAKLDLPGAHGMTPLMDAVDRGNREMVHLLVRLGASLNAKNEDGIAPLNYAIVNHDRDLVETLIRFGANVNSTSEEDVTPLLEALYCGAPHSIVRMLLDAGADATYQCEQTGDIPLELAFDDERVEIRRLFQDCSGASLDKNEFVKKGVLQDTVFADPKKLLN